MKPTPKERLVKALQKDRRYKFRELRAICGVSNRTLNALFAELRQEGFKLVFGRHDRTFFLSRVPTPYTDAFDMSWLAVKGKIGLISDPHLCSNAERLDICEAAYDRFVEEGAQCVLHAGDISDGWQEYRGHEQNVKVAGAQSQAKYVIRHYPRREGLKTFFIAGNHDHRSYQKVGVDQCSLMVSGFTHEGREVKGRDDLVYLGQYSRMLVFPNEVTAQLLHPRGGGVYAVSYPQQKRAREMRSDTRPNLQISGHYHQFSWIRQDITEMIAMPGVQDETEFFVRLGFGRQMGFCVLEYELARLGFKRIKVEHTQLL